MRVILATAGAGGSPATGAGGALAGILLGPQRITAFKPPYLQIMIRQIAILDKTLVL